jgi:trehalose 6-phosphate phosphatase
MDVADLLCPSCALFLDFDGTLVDLAEQPEGVVVPPTLIDTLRELHTYLGGAVAVISGRPMEQLDEFLAPLRLPMAGVHGAERRAADGTLSLQTTYALDAVQHAAQALLDQHPALRVELKRGSLALHYRQAPELEDLCVKTMRAAVEASPGLTLMRGKMVVEAKPGGASKGLAIDAFLHEEPFAGRQPVFMGDDFTDEVGFTVVQRRGGMGVKVGAGPSAAWHRVESPAVLRDEMAHAIALKHKGRPVA